MSDSALSDYQQFFKQATGFEQPFHFQSEFATRETLPTLLDIPTGLGKTATAVLGWLFRRRKHPSEVVRQATPRRLIYCLPMRTLVEQTEDEANRWLRNLGWQEEIKVHVLMGGAEKTNWDECPEADAILIGTQDMMLSRALNRGYGMSRYRWPIHYSLFNNDSLWVMDETQLMGVAVTTTAQLQGLREKLKTVRPTHSVWMSATLDPAELSPFDHPAPSGGWPTLELGEEDRNTPRVQQRLHASKPLQKAEAVYSKEKKKNYAKDVAAEVLKHHKPETLTLVVVNRVERAQEIFQALEKLTAKHETDPKLALIHSRFRPTDRKSQQAVLMSESHPEGGSIVVATQAIEAGVDVSATTMFVELALWPSLVQRFGRCNRKGECGTEGHPAAQVFWIDIDTKDNSSAEWALPYELGDLDTARALLQELPEVGPARLKEVDFEPTPQVHHVIRRKDILELWDTTADLAGNDLDVSRYIRDAEDQDLQVYWRKWENKENPTDKMPPEKLPKPDREELCSVSLNKKNRKFFKEIQNNSYCWDALEKKWQTLKQMPPRPGMTVLLPRSEGGYRLDLGWTGSSKDKLTAKDLWESEAPPNEGMDDDDASKAPLALTRHLQDVAGEVDGIRTGLPDLENVPWESIQTAAWWHDVGKSHLAFQTAAYDGDDSNSSKKLLAKMFHDGKPKYRVKQGDKEISRKGFRHELASALAYLAQHGQADQADFIGFLIASHHGKVRGSIRSLPNETIPADPHRRFARGIWEEDELPEVELGNGQISRPLKLKLTLMQMGESGEGNGQAQPSWTARVLALRDHYGPFKLAFFGTLLRVADWRGSQKGEQSDDR
ncbi:DEAD/DEAH box helicase [Planctomycetales bacterium 10988]|nr:DEAD/DEAH box helicase [Planctomycetales bacterium 10988]